MKTKQTERRRAFIAKHGVTGGTLESRAPAQAQHSPDWTKQPLSFNEVIRQRDNYKAHAQRLADALRVLEDHAREVYPHFESERGQRDLKAAREALAQWNAIKGLPTTSR